MNTKPAAIRIVQMSANNYSVFVDAPKAFDSAKVTNFMGVSLAAGLESATKGAQDSLFDTTKPVAIISASGIKSQPFKVKTFGGVPSGNRYKKYATLAEAEAALKAWAKRRFRVEKAQPVAEPIIEVPAPGFAVLTAQEVSDIQVMNTQIGDLAKEVWAEMQAKKQPAPAVVPAAEFSVNDAVAAAQLEAGCDCMGDGCGFCMAPNGEPLNAPAPEPVINRKKMYHRICASTGNMQIEIVDVLKGERQSVKEAYDFTAAAVARFEAEGYKFPRFDLDSIKAEQKRGFAFSLNSEWRESDETMLMITVYREFPNQRND